MAIRARVQIPSDPGINIPTGWPKCPPLFLGVTTKRKTQREGCLMSSHGWVCPGARREHPLAMRPLRGVAAAAGPPPLSRLPPGRRERKTTWLHSINKGGRPAAPSCRTHARSVGRAVSARASVGTALRGPAWRVPAARRPFRPGCAVPGRPSSAREPRHLARAVSLPGRTRPGRVRANSCCQI